MSMEAAIAEASTARTLTVTHRIYGPRKEIDDVWNAVADTPAEPLLVRDLPHDYGYTDTGSTVIHGTQQYVEDECDDDAGHVCMEFQIQVRY